MRKNESKVKFRSHCLHAEKIDLDRKARVFRLPHSPIFPQQQVHARPAGFLLPVPPTSAPGPSLLPNLTARYFLLPYPLMLTVLWE